MPQTGANPMQLLKRHAQTYIDANGLDISATYDEVFDYVHDETKPANMRRGLRHTWNRGRQPYNIAEPDDLKLSGGLPGPGKRLTRSDSFEIQNMDYFKTLDQQRVKKKLCVATLDGSQKEVPVFDSLADAGRMVRSFGHTFTTQGTIQTGAQFALQSGSLFGLFDAPRGNDVVYVPLKDGKKKGEYLRSGNIFDWSAHAKDAEKEEMDMQEVKKTVQGELQPKSELVLNTAGAMICDTKNSITGYLHYFKPFNDSTETKPTKYFSSDKKDNPIWAPSVGDGRALPAKKKKNSLQVTKRKLRPKACFKPITV